MGGNKKRKKKLRRRGLLKFFRRRSPQSNQSQENYQQPIYIQPTYSPVSQGNFSRAHSSGNNASVINYLLQKRLGAQTYRSNPPQQPAPQPVRHQPQQPAPQPVRQQPAPEQRRGIHPLDLQLFSKKKSGDNTKKNTPEKISDLRSVENWVPIFDKFKSDSAATKIQLSSKKEYLDLQINNPFLTVGEHFLVDDLIAAFESGKEFNSAELFDSSDKLIYSYKTKKGSKQLSKKEKSFMENELPKNSNDNFVLENLSDSINMAKLLETAFSSHADLIELTLNDDSKVQINLKLERQLDGTIDYSKTRINLDELSALLSNAQLTKSINLFEKSADPALADDLISTIDVQSLPKDKIVIPKAVKVAGATALAAGVLALGSLGLYQAFNGEQEVIDNQPIPDNSITQEQDNNSNFSGDINIFIMHVCDCVCNCECCHEQQEEQSNEDKTPEVETPDSKPDTKPDTKPNRPPCKDEPEEDTTDDNVVDNVDGNIGESESNKGETPEDTTQPEEDTTIEEENTTCPPEEDTTEKEEETTEDNVIDNVDGNIGESESNTGNTPDFEEGDTTIEEENTEEENTTCPPFEEETTQPEEDTTEKEEETTGSENKPEIPPFEEEDITIQPESSTGSCDEETTEEENTTCPPFEEETTQPEEENTTCPPEEDSTEEETLNNVIDNMGEFETEHNFGNVEGSTSSNKPSSVSESAPSREEESSVKYEEPSKEVSTTPSNGPETPSFEEESSSILDYWFEKTTDPEKTTEPETVFDWFNQHVPGFEEEDITISPEINSGDVPNDNIFDYLTDKHPTQTEENSTLSYFQNKQHSEVIEEVHQSQITLAPQHNHVTQDNNEHESDANSNSQHDNVVPDFELAFGA